jgi:thiamine-monophosphate kinase
MNRNLSDCAAMACLPAAAVATVALPAGAGADYAKELYLGLREAADPFDCPVVGGDTGSWPGRLAFSVTILGRSAGAAPVTRAGATPGDGVYVTGPLGGSILGRHLEFEPRVKLARQLVPAMGVTAMMDLSDGLTGDLRKLCRASGMGARVAVENVPVGEGARRAARTACNADATLWALHGGEDYELLIAAAPRRAAAVCAAIAQTGTPAVIIGEITQGHEIVLRRENGTQEAVRQGWDHFAGPAPA